jgi:tetratricopeptide (TPR) repeat protein
MNRAERRRQERVERRRQKNVSGKVVQNGGHDKSGAPSSQQPVLSIDQQIMTVGQAMNLAAQHYTKGRLPQAESICKQVLQVDPNQFDALHLLGGIAYASGRNSIAVDMIAKALAIKPDNAEAHCNQGAALKNLGKLEDAAACYQKALAINPDRADAHNNLGSILANQGRLAEAVSHYHRALAVAPGDNNARQNLGQALVKLGRFAEAAECLSHALSVDADDANSHNNLGLVLQKLGRLKDGLTHADRAVAIRPNYAAAHGNRGLALHKLGQPVDAEAAYRRALALDAGLVKVHNNLGNLLRDSGRHEEAEACYRQALELDPEHSDTLNNLGNACREKFQHEEAIQYYRRALAANFNDASIHSNLAVSLHEVGGLEEAVDHLRQALSLDPNYVDAYNNLSMSLYALGQYEEAGRCCSFVLAIEPDNAFAHWNESQLKLLQGDFETGWALYEWRWQLPSYRKYRISGLPKWRGEELQGKSVLVTAEQGIGDEIMFAGCLSDLLALRPDRCVICCEPRLVPLISRSFPVIECLSSKSPKISAFTYKDLDCQISIGDFGKLFRESEGKFPERKAYLKANSKTVEQIRSRYSGTGRGLIVGISWRGGLRTTGQSRRSIPLNELDEILRVPGVQFVDLQYGDVRNEVEAVSSKTGISVISDDAIDPLMDMDLFATQIAACDLVISVDNSTVHLAGALGQRTWTILPFCPDFRWMLDRDDSPWYPTMRLFRQQCPGDWGSVVHRVAAELTTVGAQRRQRAAEEK